MITTKKFYLKKFMSNIAADGTELETVYHQWGGEGVPIVGYGVMEHNNYCMHCAPPPLKEMAEAETSLDINECDTVILFDEPAQREYVCGGPHEYYKCHMCGRRF
jgi:hypothetical protein